jgi:hypothetical protein
MVARIPAVVSSFFPEYYRAHIPRVTPMIFSKRIEKRIQNGITNMTSNTIKPPEGRMSMVAAPRMITASKPGTTETRMSVFPIFASEFIPSLLSMGISPDVQ